MELFPLRILFFFALLELSVVPATLMAQSAADGTTIEQTDPPLDGFYAKSLSCDGVPIRGSQHVSNDSLTAVCHRMNQMLEHQQTARRNLVQHGVELHLIASGEDLSSLPEHRATTALPGNRLVFGYCYEQTREQHDLLDQCTRQIARSLMLYGFDRTMRLHIQDQFNESRMRPSATQAGSALAFWEQISLATFASGSSTATVQGDPVSLAFASNLYKGLERPRRLQVLRARNVSSLALSGTERIPAEIQFANNSERTFKLFSMDADGHLHEAGELGPFNRIVEETFLNQVWVVQDRRSVEVDRVLVEGDLSEYVAAY